MTDVEVALELMRDIVKTDGTLLCGDDVKEKAIALYRECLDAVRSQGREA